MGHLSYITDQQGISAKLPICGTQALLNAIKKSCTHNKIHPNTHPSGHSYEWSDTFHHFMVRLQCGMAVKGPKPL